MRRPDIALRQERAAGTVVLRRPGAGGGNPLVLLHGIGSRAASWEPLLAMLDRRIEAIAWDAPGYGNSAPLPEAAPAPADYAARLAAVLDELGLSRVVLAGHSLGALFAASFAALHPDRLAALALLSPAPGYGVPPGAPLPQSARARIADLQRLGPAAFAAARAPRLVHRPEAKSDIVAAVRQAMATMRSEGYAQAVRALGAGDLLADAARIAAPALVAVGAEDTVTPPAGARLAFAALAHGLQLVEVPNVGHALPQEAPAVIANLLERTHLHAHLTNGSRAMDQPGQLDAGTETETAGEAVARALADLGVTTMFGVISIHNMPILDAVARQGRIRFVPARGEAGAMNMADAYARVSRRLGVALTSTGTAAGNAAGAQVEALTAGSPVLHITTQVDRAFIDRDRAAIHDVRRQPEMLKAISKEYVRLWEPRAAADAVAAAARTALTAPAGPVSLEIPVDVQRAVAPSRPGPASCHVEPALPDPRRLDALAAMVMRSPRPMLWLGGGARGASASAAALADRGFGVVTSTNGRAVVAEAHPHSLGAFTMTEDAQRLYDDADLMIVVGSRLRGNETRNNTLRLPRLLAQIDADTTQAGRNYPTQLFVAGDARLALEGLLARLPAALPVDQAFLRSVGEARAASEAALRAALGPYGAIADALGARVEPGRHPWVRDVTIANSTFGNRLVRIAAPHLGVHALGGGIGQGIAMAIGAALAGEPAKTIALIGDGGAQLMVGELATAVETRADVVFVLMNDRGYGVIRNIQDAQYRRPTSLCQHPDAGFRADLPRRRAAPCEGRVRRSLRPGAGRGAGRGRPPGRRG